MDNLQEAYLNVYEATAMAKRGLDEPAIRQKIAKSTGGGESADRATKLADKSTFGNDKVAKQRQDLARKQRGDFRKTTSSSPGLHGYAHKSDDPEVKAKQAARGAQRSALTPAEKKQLNREEFNSLLKFLYFEGYADSYEEAENLIEEMSDEEFEEVLEAYKEPDLEKMKRQEYRHTKKAVSQSGGSRGKSKNRASKMSSIRGALERGEDPRADGYGGKRAERGNPPEDHRAAFSKNPLNNPPRPVKKAGVQKEEFESIVEFLFVEGYTDTIENAEVMAENISEDWATDILEARRSEKEGMGSPESRTSSGQLIGQRGEKKRKGEMGGRHFWSGGQGGSNMERGVKKVRGAKGDENKRAQQFRNDVFQSRTEKPGKYARMQDRKRGSEMGSPRD